MPENNPTRTLKQTRADLSEALNDMTIDQLIDFESTIKRHRNPKGGKHIEIKVEYVTSAQK